VAAADVAGRVAACKAREHPLTPTTVWALYDMSCNLGCESCRAAAVRYTDGPVYDMLIAMNERVMLPLLKRASSFCVSGQGDPFASPAYQDLLRRLTPEFNEGLRLSILTNGLGFTPENVAKLPLRDHFDFMSFSIDAATADTYRKLRGGSWPGLLANAAFAKALRMSGCVAYWSWSFVLQRDNWREVEAFIEMGREYELDHITFHILSNAADQVVGYDDKAVSCPWHPEHGEARRELQRIREAAGAGPEQAVLNFATSSGKHMTVLLNSGV